MKNLILCLACTLCAANLSAQKIQLVKDINPGKNSSKPEIIGTLSNGSVLLRAYGYTEGRELWISDGTDVGTRLVKDINPGGADGITYEYTLFANDRLFFSANDGVHGEELWVSDGTEAGTKMVKDINPGSADCMPFSGHEFVYLNGEVYFTAYDGVHGGELWVSDGTEAGTRLVKDINPGAKNGVGPHKVVVSGNVLFGGNLHESGCELWASDGSASGTNMIAHVAKNEKIAGPSEITSFNGKILFVTYGGPAVGSELYYTDGTTSGLLKDIYPGISKSSSPSRLTVIGSKVYFKAVDPQGDHFWVTDGTSVGTQMVKDLRIFQVWGEVGNNRFLLTADIPKQAGVGLWISDGTSAGTKMYVDQSKNLTISPLMSAYHFYNKYNANAGFYYGGKYYFAGDDGVNGTELWVTDGTDVGTVMVEQVGVKPDNSASSDLSYIVSDGQYLWLGMSDGSHGNELYRYKLPNASINESMASELTISPNPTSGNIQVQLGSNSFKNGYLKVTDISGKVVYDQSIAAGSKHMTIPLSNKPAGVYIVTVNLDNRISSEQVVVE